MRTPRHLLVVATLLTFTLLTAPIGQASPAAQAADAAIRLKAATFRPARGEAPAIPPGLTRAGYAEGERGYYIVQFGAPVEQAWKDQVSATGAEVLDYLPDFAFKVRMNPAQARRVEQAANIAWVGVFHPAYKLSPDLKRDGAHLYAVRIERGADAGLAAAAIARTNAQVLGREGNYLLVGADSAQLDALAQVVDVAWVENFLLPQKHNEYGAGAIMGANTANANGYDGSTQTVAVADTGIGSGTTTSAHVDIPSSRVTAVYNWVGVTDSCFQTIVDDGAKDVDSGHGTHVAGSVLSDGDANGEHKGTAPAAKLVFQATENWVRTSSLCKNFYGYMDDYYLTGLPADLRQLFQQAYGAGARIHANSWGSAAAGDYTAYSANADDFIWNNRDMTVTFSAGNEGIDANANGEVDADSTGAPATAKNVITVGASENDRQGHYECDSNTTYTSRDAYQPGQTCASMGFNNILGTYGSRWGSDYPANPIASDPTAGNQEQMAAFSSRGPTDDGRIKPDIVAPGTWVLSTYSDLHQEGYGDPLNSQNNAFQSDGWGMPLNGQYKYFGGTSMSNPLAAGGAAVVRDYYQKAHNYNASSALTKATLINSAVDLLDENNDGANDNDYPIPNSHEGWGRINLIKATSGSLQFVDQATGLSTNGTASYNASITGGAPLKVSLVWSDHASTETATKNLVNDLDLTITAPNGTTVYRGNVFSGGWSATGGTADRTNNVENVYVQSAASGTWKIEIKGFNVPNGPQPFALVVDGGSVSTPPPPPAMHIGDLDGTKALVSNRNWQATATATVHNANHGAISGATVTGSWSGGFSGTATCTTNTAGQCSMTSGNISTKNANTTFTVTNVSQSSYTYQPSSNHDPDGDSTGTAITVTRP